MSDNSIQLVNSAANSDTFGSWISKTNQLINALAQEVVTANSLPAGSLTTGNAFVNGIFSVSTLTANGALRGGNVDTTNTLVITSNVSVGNSTQNVVITFAAGGGSLAAGISTLNSTVVAVGANVVINSTAVDVGNTTVYSFMNSSVHTVASRVEVGIGAPNTVINSTAIAIGNATVFSTVNATVANVPLHTTGNAFMNSVSFAVGNSTVNAFVNSTVVQLNSVNAALVTNRDSVALANSLVGTRGRINFQAGNNITLSVTDDAAGGQVNVQINSTGGGILSAGGANTQVQFNDSATLGGSAGFTFDKTANIVSVSNALVVGLVVNVGANAWLSTAAWFLGNSTVNASSNSVLLTVQNATARANVGPDTIVTGTSVVNTTGYFIGANVSVNAIAMHVGNSTVAYFANSTLMQVATATASANVTGSGFTQGNLVANSAAVYFNAVPAARDVNPATIGFSTTITLDLTTLVNGKVTLTANTTLANPSACSNGATGLIEILQDGSGGRNMAFGTGWKWVGGQVPLLTTSAGGRDILSYQVLNSVGPVIVATLLRDVR